MKRKLEKMGPPILEDHKAKKIKVDHTSSTTTDEDMPPASAQTSAVRKDPDDNTQASQPKEPTASATMSTALSRQSFFSDSAPRESNGLIEQINGNRISEIFAKSLTIEEFRCANKRKPSDVRFDIHSLTTLIDLCNEKKKNKERPDFRFLVDLNKKAWFAKESHNRIPAPAHYQMTGEPQNIAKCLTAGNLFLTEDYSTLAKINHKSGDFRPSRDSLKWFIAILLLNATKLPFAIPNVLIIEVLNDSGKVVRIIEFNTKELTEWVNEVFSDKTIASEIRAQEQGTNQVVYKSLATRIPLNKFPSFSLGGSASTSLTLGAGALSNFSLGGSALSSFSLGGSALSSFSLGGGALSSFSLGRSALSSFSLAAGALAPQEQTESTSLSSL
jgi:hypothetical protein